MIKPLSPAKIRKKEGIRTTQIPNKRAKAILDRLKDKFTRQDLIDVVTELEHELTKPSKSKINQILDQLKRKNFISIIKYKHYEKTEVYRLS